MYRDAYAKPSDVLNHTMQLYCLCKVEMPMDVDFMVSDTLEVCKLRKNAYGNSSIDSGHE